MTGLIGSHLKRLCEDRGISIHYLTRRPKQIIQESQCKGFYWNPKTGEIDEECLAGVNKIVHLAGARVSKRWTRKQKAAIRSSRKQTGELLYTLLAKNNHEVTQFLSASAIGIYPSSLSRLYTEKSPERSDDFLGQVAREWEYTADRFEELGVDVTKVRIGLVLAPDGGLLTLLKKTINGYMGACLGSGKQWQSWIHIEDLTELFLYLLNNQMEGVFNGVAPNPVKQRYLLKSIAKVLHRPMLLPPVPASVLKMTLGEMATMILSSQLVVSEKLEQSHFIFRYTQIDKALNDLLQNN